MFSVPELGDIVCLKKNKTIWADENAFYIISQLDDKMNPIQLTALCDNKLHRAGETIKHKNLVNFLIPISIKASDMINLKTLNWIKKTNETSNATIVHFIDNNRTLEFIIIDDKLVSNIEFEFYTLGQDIKKGRIGIELPQKANKDFYKKITHLLIQVAQKFKVHNSR